MAKSVSVDYADMPAVEEDYYLVRARVVSLDENRTSQWVYFRVPNPNPTPPA